MTSRDGFFGRVMEGRVFKQVADFCSKKVISRRDTKQQSASSEKTSEQSVHLEEHSSGQTSEQRPYPEQHPDTNSDLSKVPASSRPATVHLVDSEYSSLGRGPSKKYYVKDGQRVPYHDSPKIGPPLESRYPEIVPYVDKYGTKCSAIGVTKEMVGDWNFLLQCERKIHQYQRKLEDTEDSQKRAQKLLKDIREELQREEGNSSFDRASVLEQQDTVEGVIPGLLAEQSQLGHKIRIAEGDLRWARLQLRGYWEDILKKNNLLAPDPPESVANSQPFVGTDPGAAAWAKYKPQTSSEEERWAEADALEEAHEAKRSKAIRLRNARYKLENWQVYYDSEYERYRTCVDEGRMESDRSFFDNVLLQEHQEAIKDSIEAEHEFEEALKFCKALGGRNIDDQESSFLDFPEDGYRGSMDATIVRDLDRDRIAKWLEGDEHPTHSPVECDAWESKSIDLCDSISVVAGGKERKKIDQWRSMSKESYVGL